MRRVREIWVRTVWMVLAAALEITPVWATSMSKLNALIDRRDRPTMREVAEALDWDFTSNPYPLSLRVRKNVRSQKEQLDIIRNQGAELIAQLEKAYPGALWLPLGRDAVIAGDFLDAFYLSHGQADRVMRINASTGSFNSQIPLVDVFKSMGLLNPSSGLPERKLVVLDRTSYSLPSADRVLSQSRRIMQALYQSIPRNERQSYLRQVGAIALGVNHTMITPDFNFSNFLSYAGVGRDGSPTRILSTPIPLTDSPPWHGPFGAFAQQSSRRIEGTPGSSSSWEDRQEILATMIEIFRIVESSSFEHSLEQQLDRYQVDLASVVDMIGGSIPHYYRRYRNSKLKLSDIEKQMSHLIHLVSNLSVTQPLNSASESALLLKWLRANLIHSGQKWSESKGSVFSEIQKRGEENAQLLSRLSVNQIEGLEKEWRSMNWGQLDKVISEKGRGMGAYLKGLSQEWLRLASDPEQARGSSSRSQSELNSLVQAVERLSSLLDPSFLAEKIKKADRPSDLVELIHHAPKLSAHRKVLEENLVSIALKLEDLEKAKEYFNCLGEASQRGLVTLLLGSKPASWRPLILSQWINDQDRQDELLATILDQNEGQTMALSELIQYPQWRRVNSDLHERLVLKGLQQLWDPTQKDQSNSGDAQEFYGAWDRVHLTQGLTANLEQALGRWMRLIASSTSPEAPNARTLAKWIAHSSRLVSESIPLWDDGEGKLLGWLKQFPHTRETVGSISDGLAQQVQSLLAHRLDEALMTEVFERLDLHSKGKFLNVVLGASGSVEEMLRAFQLAHRSPEFLPTFYGIIGSHLHQFGTFSPTVEQYNALIDLVPVNSSEHLEILKAAFRRLGHPSEYETLRRPTIKIKDRDYRNIKRETKKRLRVQPSWRKVFLFAS